MGGVSDSGTVDVGDLQVRQISDGLGFSDPAYFTRFFRRLTGRSPKDWREAERQRDAG